MLRLVANWKMNGAISLVREFQSAFQVNKDKLRSCVEIIICPPFPLLDDCISKLISYASIGAQDCSKFANGSFTGEVSAELLFDIGCKYVIIGHSERRSLLSESDKEIRQKLDMAIENNIQPIVCIGEEEKDQRSEAIKRSCSFLPKDKKILIAYEPLWAIGSGIIPSNKEIESAADLIKSTLPENDILYGGSVSASNAAQILENQNINGLLVGGASLSPEQLLKINECFTTRHQ